MIKPYEAFEILNTKSQVRRYINMRWFLLAAISLPGIITLFLGKGLEEDVISDILLLIFWLLSNLVFWLLLRSDSRPPGYYRTVAKYVIIFEIILITYFIYTKAGLESRSVMLYALPIILSAVLLGRPALYKTVIFTIFCYTVLIFADYAHIITSRQALVRSLHYDIWYVINTTFFIGSIIFMIGVITDFFGRIVANERAQTLKALDDLKRAQAIARVGSWEQNISSGKIEWSDEMFKLFEVPPGKAPSFDEFAELIHPDDRQNVMKRFHRAARRKSSFSVDFRLNLPYITKYIHAETRSIFDNVGPITLYGTMRDVTEERLLEESKNDFVSLASHQLRTPATVVKQYLGMVLDGFMGELNEGQRNIIQKAYDGNERQLSIVNDLLSVVRVDAGKVKLDKAPFDLVQMVRDTCDERLPRLASNDQSLVFIHRRDEFPCVADSSQLRLCLENLIDNASKYSERGTTVTVRLSRAGSHAKLSVADQGVGIAKSDIAAMFQKFTRVNNPLSVRAGGSGLGLYWVSKIISLHKGKVSVSSALGKGTKITMEFPIK